MEFTSASGLVRANSLMVTAISHRPTGCRSAERSVLLSEISVYSQSRWRSGSVSASKSKGPWFKPGSVQDFSHISDLLVLTGWLSVIGTECGLWIGTSS